MRLHSRHAHISPDLQTSRSPLTTTARRAITPLAYGHFTQAAEHIAQPSTRAAIPSGLESRLINTLNSHNTLPSLLRKAFGLPPARSTTHQEEKEMVAHTMTQAVIQTFHKSPNKKVLEEHTLSLLKSTQENTPRTRKYIQKALPEAMKWLAEHNHILSTLPEQAQRKLTEWAKACFQNEQPWNRARQVLSLNTTVKNAMITSNPLLQEHAPFIEQAIQNTFEQAPSPYQLYYRHPTLESVPITTDHPNTPFYGGYFKAHKKSEHPTLPATRVRSISGQVYELMNRLSPIDARQLRQQHDLSLHQSKVVLGQGGYGKVRLARNVNTGEFVAVKKFVAKHSQPFVYANKEAEQFKDIQHRFETQHTQAPALLDTMLDLAHVWATSQHGDKSKSYLFTPLANLGDGSAMRDRVAEYHNMGNHPAAHALFLNLAQQYTQAVAQLHQLGFHHRDIKLKNFLHQGTPNNIKARLADFGALQTDDLVNNYAGGTLSHLPPEEANRMDENNISPHAYHAEKHDLFGLGLSLLELKLGQEPKQHTHGPHLKLLDQHGRQKTVNLNFNGAGSSCQGVADALLHNLAPNHIDNQIALLLAHNPNLRPSAQHVQAVLSKETI